MKSILMVATVPTTLSGFLLPFVRHFRALGWRVEGLALDISQNETCVTEFDRVWDVSWYRNPLDPKNLLIAAPRVREIVAQGNYDLVHVHTPVAAFVTRFALRNYPSAKKPQIFYTAHGFHFHSGGSPVSNFVFRTIEKIAGAWTDHLITINRDDEAAARKYGLMPPDRIYYTPGIGLDTSYYSPDNVTSEQIAQVRQELGLDEQDALVLCVAEFTPNKRHCDQLEAISQINQPQVLSQIKRTKIHLAFAGDGATRPQLEAQAKELGIAEQVHFLGFRSDVPALIRASDALLLTSQREGLPRSIMEGLCLGTPVIGTKIRGIKDLLADDCGYLVEVGDPSGLALAIADVFKNPIAAEEMAARAQQKMIAYDVSNIIQMYEEFYNLAFSQ